MSFDKLATKSSVEKTKTSLEKKGYEVIVVERGKAALEYLIKTIPPSASLYSGSSVTLAQIGYFDYMSSGKHKWNDLKAKVRAENDQKKRTLLRRKSTLSDYYLGSVHALAENGEFIIASNTASQLPLVVFTSPNPIFIVSTKKIVSSLEVGMDRLLNHVYPLEDKQSMVKYGEPTSLNKIVIFKGEPKDSGRKIRFVLVEEDLGF